MQQPIQQLIDSCYHRATNDLIHKSAIPFGVVVDDKGELSHFKNCTEDPCNAAISHKEIVDGLSQKLASKLNSGMVTYYAITYYGKAQINNQGEQSVAFIINIESSKGEELPLYIFPYSWSVDRELSFGEYYRMNKKVGRFFDNQN